MPIPPPGRGTAAQWYARAARQHILTSCLCQYMLTSMDDLTSTRAQLNRLLDDALEDDPLEALKAVGELERDVAERQRKAVRAAAARHTWAEIGSALGVSRQAAHHKFAKQWAEAVKDELKAEVRAQKAARKRGDHAAASSAEQSRDGLIAEFKQSARAQRRRK